MRPSASSSACAAPRSPRRGSSLPEPASDPDCIFCRIVRGELPATIVNRTDGYIAIEDIAPKADVHLLVIPERHLETFRDVPTMDAEEGKRMLDFVAETARAAGLDEYRLMVFVGAGAGQTVFHLHWHVMGGRFWHVMSGHEAPA
jgi:histidine triad (HIT) family protein